MIITVTLNPALDKTVTIPGFAVNTVNRVHEFRLDPGGKGINVSKSVQNLGGDTMCLGVLGGSTGNYIQMALNQMNLPNDMVITDEPTRTNIKIVDPVLKTNTDINEPGSPLSQKTLDAVWEKINHHTVPGDTVIFAGKNPPQTDDTLLARWTHDLKARGIRVCVDTVGQPMRLALNEKPDIIKPNQAELSELMQQPMREEKDIIDAARSLVDQGVGLAVISMGSQGAVFVTRDKILRGYSPKVSVTSTVGSGDSMMAALAHYTASGCSLEEVARRSIAVASATVTCVGSQSAQLDRILPLIDKVRLEAR